MSYRKLYAIAGNPALHSKSPLLFNTYFEKSDLNAYYTRLAVTSAGEILWMINELDIQGLNITSPFKYDMFSLVSQKDEASSTIAGVNTIVINKDRLFGYNTDHVGVTGIFESRNIAMEGRKSVVLGAGGAGRAAVYGLIKKKSQVTLFNRTLSKARTASMDLKCDWDHMKNLEDHIPACDILVSTLSSSVSLIPPSWLSPKTVILDANYKGSPLCDIGKARGCRVFRGEAWLVHQAIPGLHHYTGNEVDEKIMRAGLKKRYPNPSKNNIILIGSNPDRTEKISRYLSARYGFPTMELLPDHNLSSKETIYFCSPETLSKLNGKPKPDNDAWIISLLYKNDVRLKKWLLEDAGSCDIIFPAHKNTVEVGNHICSELNSILVKKGSHG